MNKRQRLNLIKEIIREVDVENQEILIAELKKRGIIVTQATASRDINELKLAKSLSSESGINRYALPEKVKSDKAEGFFPYALKSVDFAGNTVALKCRPGTAAAVCSLLDAMDFPNVVGTVAGDDTIFALTKSERDAMDLTAKIRRLMQ